MGVNDGITRTGALPPLLGAEYRGVVDSPLFFQLSYSHFLNGFAAILASLTIKLSPATYRETFILI